MSKKLDEIRKKIDALDNKVHDLLMQRADLIVDVAREKRKTNMDVVHPAREAKMIRRLLKRHEGPLPQLAVLSIWRELVGAVCMMQTGLKVSVAHDERDGPESFRERWDMAKNYFGSVLPVSRAATTLMAVANVRDDAVNFAVLPWPEEGMDSEGAEPWWSYIYKADRKIHVICALPYGFEEGQSFSSQDNKAMVISKGSFLESGEDHSCLILEIDATVSRGRIVEALEKVKITPVSIHTKTAFDGGGNNLHMLVVEGHIGFEDDVLGLLADDFDLEGTVCISIGGYPVPPHLKPVPILD